MMKYVSIIISYLLGSIPFGYIVCRRIKGINILEIGSGNIGFTNVLRSVGWQSALLVLLGDVGKGVLAAWLGMKFGGVTFAIICSIAVLIGHSFSVFLKFKGGKMVSTGFGVMLVLSWKVALTAAAIWIFTVALTRYVSLGSIMAGLCLPVSMFYYGEPVAIKVFGVIVAVLVIYRHRTNIDKLIKGQEYKIGQKAEKK
jgi:glycerol-3-phosphate acyltransferase PlsY